MPCVAVDGMRVEIPFPVPGLPPADEALPDWRVEVERGPPSDGLEDVAWTGDVRHEGEPWARFGRSPRGNVVLLEGLGALAAAPARKRATLRHDAGPDGDVAVLRRLSPYLATLAGRLVLHAAAVALPAGAVLFVGAAGAGKSTLALGFDAAGVPVLADDHVVVDAPLEGAVVARASFPFVDASAEARLALRPECAGGGEKRSVPVRTTRRPPTWPVLGVAFVERGAGPERHFLRPVDAVMRLFRESMFVADPADGRAQVERLDACLRLLFAAPPCRLVVPVGLRALEGALPGIAGLFGGARA
jgi:hypothetical protein